MKLPQESKEWHKTSPGVWERIVRHKDESRKSGSHLRRWIYYEIICENCGGLGVAAKLDIDRGRGRFCSHSCANLARNMKGANHPGWKGGRYIDTHGYMQLMKPDYSNADKRGYVPEHIVVLEKKLGRALKIGEVSHHINRNRLDNTPENLIAMPKSKHSQIHATFGRERKI